MIEWQPIETMPKNGEWIMLGYYPDYMMGKCQGGKPIIAWWDINNRQLIDACGRRLRTKGTFSPTHWAPFNPPEKFT